MTRLRVGDEEYSEPIMPGDKGVVFTIDIEAGEIELQTYLYDEAQTDIGAYYVYVECVDFTPS